MTKPKFREIPGNEENPFIAANPALPTSKKKRFQKIGGRGVAMVDLDSDKVMGGSIGFMSQHEVDEEKFVKLYLAQAGEVFDLKKPTLKILLYIINNCLRPNSDVFAFDLKKCQDDLGYGSHNPIYSALTEMCLAKVIAKASITNLFYINPRMIYSGNRFYRFEEYIKKNDVNTKEVYSNSVIHQLNQSNDEADF
jgi:hypothetical protein